MTPKKEPETPKPTRGADRAAAEEKPLEPETGRQAESEQAGSETGSDLGVRRGHGGRRRGRAWWAACPGGVLGGVLGGTGDGPGAWTTTSRRAPIKITRAAVPPGSLRQEDRRHGRGRDPIDATGAWCGARVIQSIPLLDAAALQTVYQWVFMPAIKHGRPVATLGHMPRSTFRIF